VAVEVVVVIQELHLIMLLVELVVQVLLSFDILVQPLEQLAEQ
jgi:hypothetical protein